MKTHKIEVVHKRAGGKWEAAGFGLILGSMILWWGHPLLGILFFLIGFVVFLVGRFM